MLKQAAPFREHIRPRLATALGIMPQAASPEADATYGKMIDDGAQITEGQMMALMERFPDRRAQISSMPITSQPPMAPQSSIPDPRSANHQMPTGTGKGKGIPTQGYVVPEEFRGGPLSEDVMDLYRFRAAQSLGLVQPPGGAVANRLLNEGISRNNPHAIAAAVELAKDERASHRFERELSSRERLADRADTRRGREFDATMGLNRDQLAATIRGQGDDRFLRALMARGELDLKREELGDRRAERGERRGLEQEGLDLKRQELMQTGDYQQASLAAQREARQLDAQAPIRSMFTQLAGLMVQNGEWTPEEAVTKVQMVDSLFRNRASGTPQAGEVSEMPTGPRRLPEPVLKLLNETYAAHGAPTVWSTRHTELKNMIEALPAGIVTPANRDLIDQWFEAQHWGPQRYRDFLNPEAGLGNWWDSLEEERAVKPGLLKKLGR
jgi:hypothetical protein